jgi:hypothetical protein
MPEAPKVAVFLKLARFLGNIAVFFEIIYFAAKACT